MFNAHDVSFHHDIHAESRRVFHWRRTFQLLDIEISALLSRFFVCKFVFSEGLAATDLHNNKKNAENVSYYTHIKIIHSFLRGYAFPNSRNSDKDG